MFAILPRALSLKLPYHVTRCVGVSMFVQWRALLKVAGVAGECAPCIANST